MPAAHQGRVVQFRARRYPPSQEFLVIMLQIGITSTARHLSGFACGSPLPFRHIPRAFFQHSSEQFDLPLPLIRKSEGQGKEGQRVRESDMLVENQRITKIRACRKTENQKIRGERGSENPQIINRPTGSYVENTQKRRGNKRLCIRRAGRQNGVVCECTSVVLIFCAGLHPPDITTGQMPYIARRS